MGSQFAWFYDVILIGIIICFVYFGAKKGFIKTLLMLAGYVIALVGAFFISTAATPIVYDTCLKAPLEQTIGDSLKNIDVKKQINDLIKKQNPNVSIPEADVDKIIKNGGDLSTGFAQYAKQHGSPASEADLKKQFGDALNVDSVLSGIKDKLPAPIYQQVSTYLTGTQDSLTKVIQALNDPTSKQSSQTLTDIAIKPLALLVLRLGILIIVFTILMFVVRFLSRLISKSFKGVPVIGPLNTFLGGVFGLIQGIIIIVILAVILKIVVGLTSNELMVINQPTIDKTFIFKHIFNISLIK